MQQLANFIVDHDPMMVLQRTHDTVRYIRWAWNKDHADPIDEEELRLFLCDEHYGDLTDEQKTVARRCRDEMRKCNVKRNFRQVFLICHPFQHAVLYGLRHYGDVFFQKLCEIQIHMFHSYYCTLEFFNLCHQFRNDVLLRNLSKNSPLPEQHCTSVAAGDSDVCLSCLAGSVYHAAHDCNLDVLIHVF